MSAGGFIDACGFIPASSGTGSFVVSTNVVGYQTPAGAGAVNAVVYSYRAESADKSQWEEGFGAYTTSGTTLARTTITANSLGTTAAVSFSAAPNVFITAMSADLENASLLSSGLVSPTVGGTGVSNPTAHTIPINEGSGAQANTGVGTAGQVVTSNGAGNDPSFQNPTRTLLETLTFSASSSVASTVSWAGFDTIEFVMENLIGSAGVNLQLQLFAGSLQTTNYSNYNLFSNGGTVSTNSSPTTALLMSVAGTNANLGCSGTARLYNVGSTTLFKSFTSHSMAVGIGVLLTAGNCINTTAAVTGGTFATSAGTVTGLIKIYGLK
jgi:hypothetical protein